MIEIHLLVLTGIISASVIIGLFIGGLLSSGKVGDLYMEIAEIKRKDDLDRDLQVIEEQRSKLLEEANEQLAAELDILQNRYKKIYLELDTIKAKNISKMRVNDKGKLY